MTEAERLKKIQEVIKRQANDEALWSDPHTIGEAHLQFALRHLHAVCEGDDEIAQFYGNKYGDG